MPPSIGEISPTSADAAGVDLDARQSARCDSDGGESVPPCPSRVRSSPPQELRGEKGLSRSDLGRLSGVPYNTIRRWETGNS
ncbi:helix-turn-helix domain-containing protein, partial [Rhodococcus hoagii]|nr:helix-turn-helix domain-containing protein [Prescottella equi]